MSTFRESSCQRALNHQVRYWFRMYGATERGNIQHYNLRMKDENVKILVSLLTWSSGSACYILA